MTEVTTDVMDAFARDGDLTMLILSNGQERTAKGFENVFGQADPRFHVIDIKQPGGSALVIIEVGWKSGE